MTRPSSLNARPQRAQDASALQSAQLVVVGAGLFGLTIAERSANELGLRVVIIERRSHLGGNTFSHADPETGVEVHAYGTHVFHTSKEAVWKYVNRFAEFTDYQHFVIANHKGRAYSMPINLGTMSAFFGRALSPGEARALIEEQREGAGEAPRTLEAKAIASVGRPLYEAFIRGYTTKQWGIAPSELPASIIARLPVRFTFDARYFSDTWEGIPRGGYGSMAARMAGHAGITVLLDHDFALLRDRIPPTALTVYTGPLDAYFSHAAGHLSWRTLRFEREILPVGDHQGTAVVNYVDEAVPYTRVHEFRHLDPARPVAPDRTVIFREYSAAAGLSGDPYYPVGAPRDRDLLTHYRELARREDRVLFGGRLGSYAYLDMDMAIASAFGMFEQSIRPWFRAGRAHA